MTADERENLEDVARVTASLDQPAAMESSTTLGELVAPDARTSCRRGADDGLRPGPRRGRALPGLQRDVLRLRFGFDGDSPASLQSTAERLGVGVRRVRRAEEEALAASRSTPTSASTRPPVHQTPRRPRQDPPSPQGSGGLCLRPDRLAEVGLQVLGHGDVNSAARDRMREGQLEGVQEEAPDPRRLSGSP
jgi:hypothetical protein